MSVVTSFLTFPAISWWAQARRADTLLLDGGEHFGKMSFRNRYRIAGSNNSILLTVPLVAGRNQRTPMKDVRIHNAENWQIQHWRTLVSVYKRSPYFEHYEDTLRPLYEAEFTHLVDFNLCALQWVSKQLRIKWTIQETEEYIKDYGPDITDLRDKNIAATLPQYYQLFADRIGFVPDLSILDLLFMEGPYAGAVLDRVGVYR